MKVLTIPDVHLKPWMFTRAAEIMKEKKIRKAVCLMDIADDWKQQYNLDLYTQTYDRAIRFAKEFPETLWCYGNHDVCYLWNERVPGYSKIAPRTVIEKLRLLRDSLPDERQLAYVHRIDKVLFVHGGLLNDFVENHVPVNLRGDVDRTLAYINGFGYTELWDDDSPIWFRPQYERAGYMAEEYLQVIGHTNVETFVREGCFLSCDVFFADRERNPQGSQEFLVIDTESWEYEGVR